MPGCGRYYDDRLLSAPMHQWWVPDLVFEECQEPPPHIMEKSVDSDRKLSKR